MFKNYINIRLRHERFVKKICKTGIVYYLENEDGIAISSANYFDDDNDEPIDLLCFWAEKVRTKSCIKNGWNSYRISKINLNEFLEFWCVGISNDDFIIGTSFDNNMFGFEIEPLELILELILELKKSNILINFKNYQTIDEFEKQVKVAMDLE